MTSHLDRETLESFLAGGLSDEEDRALQRHLFTCPRCEAQLTRLLPLESPGWPALPESQSGRGDAICRIAEENRPEAERRRADLAAERAAAPGLWSELEPCDQERRRELVWHDPRYQSWGLFELLIDLSHRILPQSPREAEDLAHLALDVAEQLRLPAHAAAAVESAKARAWIQLAHAQRLLSDFRQAEQAFQTAELHLSRSWLDPLDEGLLLESKAPLRRAQGRFDEALQMLDSAVAIYREINEPHLHGRALLVKGLTLQYRGGPGDSEASAECFRTSLFLLDGKREPRLVLVGQYNLIRGLYASGRFVEAAALLPEAQKLVQEAGSRSDRLRLEWLAGQIAAAQGRWDEAEAVLLIVRKGFIEDGVAFDAALASLDLASLYARLGRTLEVKRLAAEMLPIFKSLEVPREALAALLFFQQAAERETLTLGLVQELSSYLEKVQSNPQLRFLAGEQASAPS
ncbi:MAG TPA: zf-HC2 domain-containing protein [Thermoanaerobaculia bacterium]|nr:zf-HC2 domain-containing protein [Thermoanaerobaculia bacterium]